MDKLFQRLNNIIVEHALNLAFSVALIVFAFDLCLRYVVIFCPFPDLAGIEQNIIHTIQRILAGYELYKDPASPPYSITQLTPLYYYLTFFTGKLLNVNPDNVFDVFILSRSVSLVLNLALLGVCFLLLKGIYKLDAKVSAITCVFIFLNLERHIYSRPDSLYTLFFVSTLFFFILFLKESRSALRILFLSLSSLSVMLALYTKQTAIFLPVLILFFLIFYIRNIKYVLVSVFFMIAFFFLLLFISSGSNVNIFLENVYKGIDNGIDILFFYHSIVKSYIRGILIWNILGFGVALYYLKKDSEISLKFLSISIFITFIFAVGTGLKYGATPSYFTEYIIVVFITLTLFIFIKNRFFQTDFMKTIYVLTVLFVLPYQAVDHYGVYEFIYTNYAPNAFEKSEEVYRYLSEDIELDPSESVIIMEEKYTERRFLDNFFYRHNLIPHKSIHKFNEDSTPQSSIDYTHLKDNINNGLVTYLIASRGKDIRNYYGAEVIKFKHLKDINDYSIYVYSDTNVRK